VQETHVLYFPEKAHDMLTNDSIALRVPDQVLEYSFVAVPERVPE
jgi:hypothetical protein